MIYRDQPHDIENALSYLEKAAQDKEQDIHEGIHQGIHQIQHTAQSFIANIQNEVEQNPWGVVSKVALYGFGIGVFLGARQAATKSGEAK